MKRSIVLMLLGFALTAGSIAIAGDQITAADCAASCPPGCTPSPSCPGPCTASCQMP